MCNQNILSCSFWLSPLLLLWRFAKKHPSHLPVTTYQMPGDSGQNHQSSPGSTNPSLSWTQHACFLTTFMAFSQTGSNLSKSLLYRRPQMGHVTPGAASKVQTEKCYLIPWPAAQYAAQYSVKLCCHKGALQAGVQFAHHKIWVSPTPPGSFLAKLLSGEQAGLRCCMGWLLPTHRTWLLSEPREIPVKPGLQLAEVPPDGSLTLLHTAWKISPPIWYENLHTWQELSIPLLSLLCITDQRNSTPAACCRLQMAAQCLELGGPATPTATLQPTTSFMLPLFACQDSTRDGVKALLKSITGHPLLTLICTGRRLITERTPAAQARLCFCKSTLANPDHLLFFTRPDHLSCHFWRQA